MGKFNIHVTSLSEGQLRVMGKFNTNGTSLSEGQLRVVGKFNTNGTSLSEGQLRVVGKLNILGAFLSWGQLKYMCMFNIYGTYLSLPLSRSSCLSFCLCLSVSVCLSLSLSLSLSLTLKDCLGLWISSIYIVLLPLSHSVRNRSGIWANQINQPMFFVFNLYLSMTTQLSETVRRDNYRKIGFKESTNEAPNGKKGISVFSQLKKNREKNEVHRLSILHFGWHF